jgi:imidazolonepropionase-like amidohydrolase
MKKIVLTLAAALMLTGATTAPVVTKQVIHAGTLIDGTGGPPRRQVSIIIEGERIVSVVAGFVTPAGAQIVNLSDATVMPGFIDAHVHIAAKLPSSTNMIEDWVTHSDIDRAFDGAKFGSAMLQQGFTAARDVGGGSDTVSLRNAINQGKVTGPRLWVSLEALGPTAGHGDARYGIDPHLPHRGWDNNLVDANLIKIMPSGGIASSGDDPRQKLMDDDEIAAVITTAHSLGMKVAAHAYPSKAIDAAVRAKVDSIEHGSFATNKHGDSIAIKRGG